MHRKVARRAEDLINDAQLTLMKWLASKTLERLTANALVAGRGSRPEIKSRSLRMVEWDISGKCRSPVLVQMFGRPLLKQYPAVLPAQGKPFHIDLWTRCRKCDPCLHARRLLWQDKGRYEYAAAPRSWLLTVTNRPDVHARQLALARHKLAKQGLDFDALPYGEQFQLRAREMGTELTKFLKRLRKNSGAPFRYLAVTEMHKNGAPHLHVLIHETDMDRPLRKHMIQSCWSDGFSNCKLVESVNQAVYVCKYLSKTKVARVRASIRYGKERSDADQAPSGLKNEMMKENSTPKSGALLPRSGPRAKQAEVTFQLVGGLSREGMTEDGNHARSPKEHELGDIQRVPTPLSDPTSPRKAASENSESATGIEENLDPQHTSPETGPGDVLARLHGRHARESKSDQGDNASLGAVARGQPRSGHSG